MNRGYWPVWVSCFLLMAPYTFGQTPAPKTEFAGPKMLEEIVARVNSDIILKSEYDRRVKTLSDELAQPDPQGKPGLKGAALDKAIEDAKRDVLRNLIDERLLLQKAKELDMTSELEVVKTMEKLRLENHFATTEELEQEIAKQGSSVDDFKETIGNRYLTSRVVQQEVYNKIIITTEDLRTYYDAHKKDLERPAGVSLAEITVFTEKRSPEEVQAQRKKIEDALAALKKGDEFTAVAQKYSEDDNAGTGGDIGFIEKNQLNQDYETAVSKLARKGDISDIITMPYGFVILKLQQRHDGGVLQFEIAEGEIQNIIIGQRAEPKIRDFLTKLRDEGFTWVRDGYVDTGEVKKEQKPGGQMQNR